MIIEMLSAVAAVLPAGVQVTPHYQEPRVTICYVTAVRGADNQPVMIKTGPMPEGNNFAGKAARYRTWIETDPETAGRYRVTAAACVAPAASSGDANAELQVVEERFLRQNAGAVAFQPSDRTFRQQEAAIP